MESVRPGDNEMSNIIYWSVAWGTHTNMLQALVKSMRANGITERFIAYTDKILENVENRPLDDSIPKDQPQFWKFEYLARHMANEKVEALVFIDADHFFVRAPTHKPLEILGTDPWHSFLESPINSSATRRGDWWSCPNEKLVSLYRRFGVVQKEIRNTNGGFWICRPEFADHARMVAKDFNLFASREGYHFPEEVSISVLSHMFSKDYSLRFGEKWESYWASEWTGQFSDRVPDGTPWRHQSYMTGMQSLVNPAIVHAMRSKNALAALGAPFVKDIGSVPSVTPSAASGGCAPCQRRKAEAEAAAKLSQTQNQIQVIDAVSLDVLNNRKSLCVICPEHVDGLCVKSNNSNIVTMTADPSAKCPIGKW
jgi:hypothetical protein